MDKDRVEGVAHQAKGSIKEAAGKVTGDKRTEAEGAAEKAAGKVQNAVGGAKDAVKDARAHNASGLMSGPVRLPSRRRGWACPGHGRLCFYKKNPGWPAQGRSSG